MAKKPKTKAKRINSRSKGKAGELEFSKLLTARNLVARRGQQYAGGTESPDVICEAFPTVHFEVKRTEAGNLYKWLDQAIGDAKGVKLPVVVHRKNGKEWVAIFPIKEAIDLLLLREAALI